MVYLLVIVGLAVLILVHEIGHFLVAKLLKMRVDEFGVGFPPRLLKKKIGETTYSLNVVPFGGFVRLHGESDLPSGKTVDDKPSRDGERGFNDELAWKKSLVILSGVFMNVVLGWLLLSAILMVGMPRHLVIADVAEDSPAFSAGLKSGDVVESVSAGGTVLNDPVSPDSFTELVKANSDGFLALSVGRDGQGLEFEVKPRQNPPDGQGPLGVAITEIGFESRPFFESLASGILETWSVTKMVFEGLGIFIRQVFVSPGTVENVAGPVGIVFLAAQATDLGFIYFLQLLALISVNLAVLNLLPFPALDGGRFLFVVIEKLTKKRIPRRAEMWVNGAGFAILILLMVFVTIKDVERLF
jgi:regulator of sigma E protease